MLWILTLYSTNLKGQYWARHCLPADSSAFCASFDAIILAQAQVAISSNLNGDCFAEQRLCAPSRHGGMGLTSLFGTREAAFVAACAQAIPSFLDTYDRAGGIEHRGVLELPAIVARVGRDAFDGERQPGWQQYFDSGSSTAEAMAQAAEALRARVPEGYEGQLRILRLPAAALPAGGHGLQAAFVSDTKQLVHDAITAVLQARQRTDRQLQQHVNSSRESALFARERPLGLSKVPDDEWMEMCARLLGLLSPACAPIVGQPLRAVGQRACAYVGPFGDELAAAITFKEGHFAKFQHDPVLDALCEFARSYVTASPTFAKREDADFFGSVLRNGPAARSPDALERKRVLTPDLRALINGAMRLIEMKTIHHGP